MICYSDIDSCGFGIVHGIVHTLTFVQFDGTSNTSVLNLCHELGVI